MTGSVAWLCAADAVHGLLPDVVFTSGLLRFAVSEALAVVLVRSWPERQAASEVLVKQQICRAFSILDLPRPLVSMPDA